MSKKILLADDSITIQKVIELTFSDEDFEVVTVGNGRLALEKLADTRPDVVLCDIIMPEKDGYEVCERIKKNPETAHIPVLLLTGAFEPFDQERAARAGSDGFLAKPFEPETLIGKVKELLARAPSRTSPPSLRPRVDAPAPPAASPVPPAPPSPPPLQSASSFLPEEPFDAFDAEAIEEVEPEESAGREAPLAAVTPEESLALTGRTASDSAPADPSSTVMFHRGDVAWEDSGGFTTPEPTVSSVQGLVKPEPMARSETEVSLTSDSEIKSRDEGPSFEEVIQEEDAAFARAGRYAREEPAVDEASPTVMFEPAPEEPPSRDGVSTGRFSAVGPSSSGAAIQTTPPVGEAWAASTAGLTEAGGSASSEAASVPVPLEMVEKIAQRVLAQVSEKIVREIAWEVIPDLAEALIRQEIERLKAELQKL